MFVYNVYIYRYLEIVHCTHNRYLNIMFIINQIKWMWNQKQTLSAQKGTLNLHHENPKNNIKTSELDVSGESVIKLLLLLLCTLNYDNVLSILKIVSCKEYIYEEKNNLHIPQSVSHKVFG